MKRIFLIAGLLILVAYLHAQGLRQSVCIVYPTYSAKDSTLLAAYADDYHRAGLASRAKMLNSYIEGTFGSGVVVEHKGKLYVLTNRHVAGYAAEAKIVFQQRKKNLTYEHCPVYSSDMLADLAVIELPVAAATECEPIALEQQAVADGEDITAVGFPGLGGKASWQLTRGTVSNSSLVLEQNQPPYIQHTAPIDPGSSGGPLLRRTGETYSLIGINTLKAFYRDRVGIAIAMPQIQAFLGTLSTPNISDQQLLQALRPYDAGRWHEYYAQLPQAKRDSLKQENFVLPLDFALAVYEAHNVSPVQDELVEEATLINDRFGIDNTMTLPFDVTAGYDCFFNGYHNVNLAFGFHSTYLYQEARLTGAMMFTPADTLVGGAVGYGIGVHVPIRINRTNRILPRALVAFQLGAGAHTRNGYRNFGLLFTPSLRIGLDYRYTMKKVSLIAGVEYVFEPAFSNLYLSLPAHSVSMGNFYLLNGLGVRIGVGF